MSKKYKWGFIENKEVREELVKSCDMLKACAKTYYVKYMDYYDEIMEPYKSLCASISGGEKQMILYVVPEMQEIFDGEISKRCREEKERFLDIYAKWNQMLNCLIFYNVISEDKVEKIRKQVEEDLIKMRDAISRR